MKLYVEENDCIARDGNTVLGWRWVCDCGGAGHWQHLSYMNSHNAAMSHYEREHVARVVNQPPIPWFQSA